MEFEDVNEELDLLKEYMKYFINLRFEKESYLLKKKHWERNNKEGPGPRLMVRNESYLEPRSFQDWLYAVSVN